MPRCSDVHSFRRGATEFLSRPGALLVILCVIVTAQGGCRRDNASQSLAAAPTSGPAVTTAPVAGDGAPKTYEDKKHGVKLSYPSVWTVKADPDYDLRLALGGPNGLCTITFDSQDVPSVPLFGIPMGMVESHYIDDIKSKHAGAAVTEKSDYSLAGAKARRVTFAWTSGGAGFHMASILIVHGDDVFILAADAPDADWASTQSAEDAVAKSIAWTH